MKTQGMTSIFHAYGFVSWTDFPSPIPAFDFLLGEGFFVACEDQARAIVGFTYIDLHECEHIVQRWAIPRKDHGVDQCAFTFDHELGVHDASVANGWFVPCPARQDGDEILKNEKQESVLLA